MSVKVHRGLSHFRRLGDPEVWIQRIERCQRALGDRREAMLVQLRADMVRDDDRLERFLALIPPWIRVAVELRHRSWDTPRVHDILERHGAAYVVTSGLGLACIPRATADFVYVRLHGPADQPPYAGGYSGAELSQWAGRIRSWAAENRRVLVYFNNDGHGHAVRDALRLRDLLT